jgi:DNA-binding MltR family transcriptional regulator
MLREGKRRRPGTAALKTAAYESICTRQLRYRAHAIKLPKATMTSKGKKTAPELAIEALMRRSRSRPHSHDLWGAFIDAEDSLTDADSKQHDRSLILVLSGAVEQTLEMAISTHFVVNEAASARMFDDSANGPLATFAAKIRIGYALGIYSKTLRDELNMIRHIRNLVAHAKEPLDFSSPEIVAGCATLVAPDRYMVPQFQLGEETKSAKRRYLHAARLAFLYLEDPNAPKPMRAETHPGRHAFSD